MTESSWSEAPTLVVVAMTEEAAPFLEAMADAAEVEGVPLEQARAWRGTLAGEDVLLLRGGIGLVAAASTVTWAISTFGAAQVISAGTAGGLARSTEVGDIAVSDAATYGTADATEFGYERGQVPRQPVRFPVDDRLLAAARKAAAAVPAATATSASGAWHVGRVLSGDSFVTQRNVADMREAFPDAVATDMESCAVAQVAHAAGVPFLAVRGISDLCGPEAGQDFHLGVDEAAARSRDAVVAVLEALRG